MFAYIVLRAFYGVYLVVSLFIFYRMVSQFIFHPETRSARHLLKYVVLSVIWPIALFSRNGRNQLKETITKSS